MAKYTVHSVKTILSTHVFDVTHERVMIPAGVEVEKHLVRHRGAAVMMARNARGQVLLIRQFRLRSDGAPGSSPRVLLPRGRHRYGPRNANCGRRLDTGRVPGKSFLNASPARVFATKK